MLGLGGKHPHTSTRLMSGVSAAVLQGGRFISSSGRAQATLMNGIIKCVNNNTNAHNECCEIQNKTQIGEYTDTEFTLDCGHSALAKLFKRGPIGQTDKH